MNRRPLDPIDVLGLVAGVVVVTELLVAWLIR